MQYFAVPAFLRVGGRPLYQHTTKTLLVMSHRTRRCFLPNLLAFLLLLITSGRATADSPVATCYGADEFGGKQFVMNAPGVYAMDESSKSMLGATAKESGGRARIA